MVRTRSLVREKNRARKLTMFGAALLVSFLSVAYFCGLPGPVGGSTDTTQTAASTTPATTTAPTTSITLPVSSADDPPFDAEDFHGSYTYEGLVSNPYGDDATVCGQVWAGGNSGDDDAGYGYALRAYSRSFAGGYCFLVLIGTYSSSLTTVNLAIHSRSLFRLDWVEEHIVSDWLRSSNLGVTFIIDQTLTSCPLSPFTHGFLVGVAAGGYCTLSHSGDSIFVREISCRAGYFHDRSSNTCDPCLVTLESGTSAESECVGYSCEAGFYSASSGEAANGRVCARCPEERDSDEAVNPGCANYTCLDQQMSVVSDDGTRSCGACPMYWIGSEPIPDGCEGSEEGHSNVPTETQCRDLGFSFRRANGKSYCLEPSSVNLVGLEVTQGVQNWMGTLDLVRNKKVAVRAFFETEADGEEVEVTADLRARTSAGTDLGSEEPVNPGGSVTVSDNVAQHRWRLDSSLNFVLPLEWSDLDEDETLVLTLDFPDTISVNCLERIVPAATCSADVVFLNVPAPDIVMVPLEVGEAGDTDEPSYGDLMEQFARINSLMPFSSEKIDDFDVDAFIIENYTFDSRPFARDAEPADIRERLLNLREEVNDDAIYLGVLSGEPDWREVPGDDDRRVRTYGSANDIPGEVAYWFTTGIDGGSEANAYFGHRRNVGSHELGHVLGQQHVGRRNLNNDPFFEGECRERTGDTILYPYFATLVNPASGVVDENPISRMPRVTPVLGPLGDVDTEVWGLDVRYVDISPETEVLFYPEQISTLAVSNPRRVFSIMSYCESFREDHEPEIEPEEDTDDAGDDDVVEDVPDNQGRWMDAFHHERIIGERREAMESDVPGVDVGPTIVMSDMFSGRIEFSDSGAVSSAVVGDVFSRPRGRVSAVSGDYVLELRDASGGVVRSVSFEASAGVDDRSGSEPYFEPMEAVFSFVVSDPPEYSSFAVKHDGSELLVVEKSANAPSVSVSGPTAGQVFGAGSNISVSWSGSDADGDELSYRVYYSTDGGKVYMPLSLETTDTSMTLPAGRLRGSSRARIGVSVSDGARSSFAETAVFSVANHAPQVSIRTPVSGDVLAENQGFVVEAVAYDMEDGLVPSSHISWRSSIDGSLGAGRYLVLSAADLSAGSHTITVTATDASGLSASDSVNVVISLRNALPVANDDNFQVSADEEMLIDVLANDVDVEGDVDLSSFRIVQPPQMGFAQKVRTQDGVRIKYFSNTSGRDHFSYIICDAVDRCDTARVSIDVGLADCTILGTEADDVIEGTSGDDVICGLGGDDTIDAKGGDDVIRGGLGDDTIYARAGNDVIYGEIGNDFILGHNGADIIYGGLDDDTIYGGGDVDRISGGHGQDELYGEAGNDTIEGGDGADTIHGGRGDDTIRGGDGDDTIRGNAGADTIEPGKGTDTLLGISPEDTVTQTA